MSFATASGIRVGNPGPRMLWTGVHSRGSWHFRDSCHPERPTPQGSDGCAVDFGVGGADLDALKRLFLRPDVARFIPEMILDHDRWNFGKRSYYAPNDHSGRNRHLHTAILPCVHLPLR